MDVLRIPPLARDGGVHVVVEIPKGGRNKYEYDPEFGVLRLDRTLYSAVHYPTDYGFVPGTKGADGDPIDAMVLVEQETFPGCLVTVRLIGVVTVERTDGSPEPKLLGVPVAEPRFAEYRDIADLPRHLLKEIEHFLSVFKDLEGSDLRVRGWEGPERARAALERAIIRSSPPEEGQEPAGDPP